MNLDEALRIIAAGSSVGSPGEFEAAVVVVAQAAQRVADIERRARQVVTGSTQMRRRWRWLVSSSGTADLCSGVAPSS
jgi:hypothetical protein